MDAHALHRRGWSISAIARHLGHDHKTIRAYLHGGRVAGQRRRWEPDGFEPFVGYCRERLTENPHLWATTLFDELCELGYDHSYPTLTPAAELEHAWLLRSKLTNVRGRHSRTEPVFARAMCAAVARGRRCLRT